MTAPTPNHGGAGVSVERTYPEHDKLSLVKDHSQAVGEFIEWLGEQGLVICDRLGSHSEIYAPTTKSRDRLLALHFDIDLDRLSAEKDAMLEEFRSAASARAEGRTS